MSGRLQTLFAVQRGLMAKMGVSDRADIAVDEHKLVLTEAALGLVEESLEVFKESNKFKSWDKNITVDDMKEELVDVMHYLIECYVLLGGDSEDFYQKFLEKNQKNHDRVDFGKEDVDESFDLEPRVC